MDAIPWEVISWHYSWDKERAQIFNCWSELMPRKFPFSWTLTASEGWRSLKNSKALLWIYPFMHSILYTMWPFCGKYLRNARTVNVCLSTLFALVKSLKVLQSWQENSFWGPFHMQLHSSTASVLSPQLLSWNDHTVIKELGKWPCVSVCMCACVCAFVSVFVKATWVCPWWHIPTISNICFLVGRGVRGRATCLLDWR